MMTEKRIYWNAGAETLDVCNAPSRWSVSASQSVLAGTNLRVPKSWLHPHNCTFTTVHTPPFLCSNFGEGCFGVPLAHYEALQIGPNMDNWGDPWADNAKSPTKDAVTSPLPPTFAPAPALLNGFLDDAGWGNEDESFGDWSTAPAIEEQYAPPAKSSITESFTAENVEAPSNDDAWGIARDPEQDVTRDEGDWAAVTLDAPKDEEQVLSETSDSTTVQANEHVEEDSTDASARLQADDESSARTSTSPSEASHHDIPVESPRTSYEEERGIVKPVQADTGEGGAPSRVSSSLEDLVESAGVKDIEHEEQNIRRTSEDLVQVESVHTLPKGPASDLGSPESTNDPSSAMPTVTEPRTSVPANAFKLDPELLETLFEPHTEEKDLDQAADGPIYSTSARKAWYRLTRKQTMREFNHGADDDNYVRVTWTNSDIRTEVNNIVGRWAREDRLSGTGPGARASFYWDTPAHVDLPGSMHAHQRSSVLAGTIASAKESVPPLSTNVPAAFNWSSASAGVDPWHQPSPGLRSTSSPIAPPIPPTVTNARRQEVRAASLDLTSHKPGPSKHARNLTVAHETPAVANLISPPITNTNPPSSDPWAGLEILDVQPTPQDNPTTANVDDEDEWGEMVSSPTVSTPTLTEPISQADTRNNTISTTATTPQSNKSVAGPDQSPDTMSTTTIVRLKSTISPTSAYFKPKLFVPLGAEQGPIGPGILKPANRSVSVTRKKVEEPEFPKQSEPVSSVAQEEFVSEPDAPEEFSDWQTSVPDVAEQTKVESIRAPSPVAQEVVRPMTPPQPVPAPAPTESNVDAWADADFSFFESSLPIAPPTQPKSDPNDLFSVFEGRSRSVSAASSAKTFTRSPPRKVPSPPIQPLTGATSSAQRRKNEEEATIRDILAGLPDLSYMLRS
jgi:hypothetical protein